MTMDRATALRTLELPPESGVSDVKRAYRLLAKVWHPDRFRHDPSMLQAAENKLKMINAAYKYLLNNPHQTTQPDISENGGTTEPVSASDIPPRQKASTHEKSTHTQMNGLDRFEGYIDTYNSFVVPAIQYWMGVFTAGGCTFWLIVYLARGEFRSTYIWGIGVGLLLILWSKFVSSQS